MSPKYCTCDQSYTCKNHQIQIDTELRISELEDKVKQLEEIVSDMKERLGDKERER